MRIIHFSDIEDNLWDSFCDVSDEAWVFHRSAWVERDVQLLAASNESFAISEESRIVAIQPLYFCNMPEEKLIHSGIHRHTGLAMENNLESRKRKEVTSLAMNQIFSVASSYDADRIQLNSHNCAPFNLGPSRKEIPFWVSDYGFHLGLYFSESGYVPVPGMSTCNADQIISLGDNEENLFNGLDEACRRAVRKAVKNNLTMELDQSLSDVSVFYELSRDSAVRTGETLPEIDYYEALRSSSRYGECRMLFAKHDSIFIGGLLLLAYKGVVNFMAGVSKPEYLHLRVNDFMHWSAISWAKKNGYCYYRLGPIFPEVPGDWRIAKVSRFKGKFGGRNVPVIQGSYFMRPEKYLGSGRRELELLCRPREHAKKQH